MLTLILLEIAITVLHVIASGFEFPMVFMVISRGLFFMKMLGLFIPVKVLVGLEYFSVFLALLIPAFLNKPLSLGNIFGYLIAATISSIIIFIDDYMYVYVEEDITG